MTVIRRTLVTLSLLLPGLLLPALAVPPGPAGAASAPAAGAPDPCPAGRVALTFDDGPAGGTTRDLVAALRRLRVPATFFMVGQRAAADPATARFVERSGFLVANHSWAHEDLRTRSRAEVRRSLRDTRRALRDAGARPTVLMRPPYGALAPHVSRAISDVGLVPVLWSVDPRDWAGGTARRITASTLEQLTPGRDHVVLLHDGVANSAATVAAVPAIVRRARRAGHCFVGLDEAGRPGYPTPRVTLSAASTRVREGESVRLTATLDRPAGRATRVTLRLRGRAATGADLGELPTQIEVPAGRVRATVTVPVLRDRTDEPTELLRARLTRSATLKIAGRPVTVSVLDRDPPPTVRARGSAVTEPATGSTPARVTFRLSRPSARTVVVEARTVAGSAGGRDFTATRTRLSFPPGTTVTHLDVPVLADAETEPTERFTVRFTVVRHARAGGRPVVVRILAPPVSRPSAAPAPADPTASRTR